jgi:BirA family biotin operon repressor/biotin-[acetyl-CoA-carboxylase] ligase
LERSIRNEIVRLFVENPDESLSGEELSRRVGCSRAAVWKQIEELRKQGYEIEAKPRQGYRLRYRPDRVAPEEIYPHLQTERLGCEIRYVESTPSTQNIAHQWAKDGAPEGAVVIAEEQVNGRGRMGKAWHSPPRTGIWMSLILRPPISLAEASQLTLLASVGVQEAISKETNLPTKIKWPNDILVQGKKVCGILTEIRGEQDRIHYVIMGIGMNVNTEAKDFPEELANVGTSLAMETGRKIHRASLVAGIVKRTGTNVFPLFATRFFPHSQKMGRKSGDAGASDHGPLHAKHHHRFGGTLE